jgi:hypothetical protein
VKTPVLPPRYETKIALTLYSHVILDVRSLQQDIQDLINKRLETANIESALRDVRVIRTQSDGSYSVGGLVWPR